MLKRLMRYRGLMVLVLWQAVPTRVGFGIGGGQLEYAALNCHGSVIDSDAVPYKTAAVDVEHWSGNGRLRANAGYQWADSASANGPFGGLLLSHEGTKFGIGGGGSFIPQSVYDYDADGPPGILSASSLMGSAYLRYGSKTGMHVRAELFPPAAHTFAEAFRIVVGFNLMGADNKPSGSIGVGEIITSDSHGSSGVVWDFFKPVSPSVALGMRGFASPGLQNAQLGLTTQVRVTVN